MKLWAAELVATSKLGAPIMAGMVSQMLMGVADTLMVGRLGVIPLAAGSFIITIVHPPVTFAIGLLSAVAVLTSQAFGGKRKADAGEALRAGLLTALVAGLFFGAGSHIASPLLSWLGQAPEVVNESRSYFVLFAWSMLPALLAHAAKQFSEALNRPWVPNLILFGGVLANVLLNWILIYGNWGAPALGLEGAGWATLLARLIICGALLCYIARSTELAPFRPARWLAALKLGTLKAMFRVGLPVGAQHLLEVSAFALAGLMIGWISAEALAAHQIALNCAATTFMFALGLGMGVSIRVGQAWGAGKPARMRRTGFVGFAVAALLMAAFGIIFALGGRRIAEFFIADPVVIAITAQLLVIAALFQLADGIQVVAISALRGMSDVRIPALIAVLAYWVIALPLGYLLAFRTSLGPAGMWIGLASGLAAAAFCLSWRFHLKTAAKNRR